MRWKRSREHLIRRIDRYYLLAAAKPREMRQAYLDLARRYRMLLAVA